jgi:hypothetical protein
MNANDPERTSALGCIVAVTTGQVEFGLPCVIGGAASSISNEARASGLPAAQPQIQTYPIGLQSQHAPTP